MRVSEANVDTTLATRALRLYIQTVGKAKLARKNYGTRYCVGWLLCVGRSDVVSPRSRGRL